MNVGLLDIDGRNFPNVALMKIAGWHRAQGDSVDWATAFEHYDRIYRSKVFTFTPDDLTWYQADEEVRGGTGYDVRSRLPDEIDAWTRPDYSIYPNIGYSVQFYSRGCIRRCPFCLVHDKEGGIHSVEPMELNPVGRWTEVLDNNFFAAPDWRDAVRHLRSQGLPVKFHGIDLRILDDEQADALASLRLKGGVHVAWDDPKADMTERLAVLLRHVRADDIICYVLVGFNSTREQDMRRLRTLRSLGVLAFVQPYRDYDNSRRPSQYELDLAHWANKHWIYMSTDFADFVPRRGFRCGQYLEE